MHQKVEMRSGIRTTVSEFYLLAETDIPLDAGASISGPHGGKPKTSPTKKRTDSPEGVAATLTVP